MRLPKVDRYGLRPLTDPLFEGWDTETISGKCQCGHNAHSLTTCVHCGCDDYQAHYEKGGAAFILCNSNDTRELVNTPFIEILNFLYGSGHRKGPKRINAWWNLNFDVQAIFKWAGEEVLKALYPPNNGIGKVEYGPYEIQYLRKKALSIRRKDARRTVRHYDANNFFQQSLAKAALKYLNRKTPEMKARRGDDMWQIYKDHPRSVIEYCMWDATATRDLMELFFERLRGLEFYPSRPLSAGYIAEQYLRMKVGNLPGPRDVSAEVNSAFWEAFRGGWVDLLQRGTWDRVWKYDINSAYPYAMMNLPDVRQGEWLQGVDLEAPLGVLRVRFRQERFEETGLASWLKTSHAYLCYDVWCQAWITLQEYKAFRGHMPMEVLRSWHFRPDKDCPLLFERAIRRLVEYKNSHDKTDGAYLAAKMIVNSLYGKSCQRTPTQDDQGNPIIAMGKLMMPVYAATITATTRMQVLEAIRNDLGSIIAISTDSIASTKPLNLPLNSELGGWKEEASGEKATFVYPGIYQVGEESTHTRGFRITTCQCGHDSTRHLIDKCEMCQCSKFKASLKTLLESSKTSLRIAYERPWGAAESFRLKETDLVGRFEKRVQEKGIDIIRRLWPHAPKAFSDLLTNTYKSIPLPLSAHPRVNPNGIPLSPSPDRSR